MGRTDTGEQKMKPKIWRYLDGLVKGIKDVLVLVSSLVAFAIRWLANLVFIAGAVGLINQHIDEWVSYVLVLPNPHVEPLGEAVIGLIVVVACGSFLEWLNRPSQKNQVSSEE